MTTTPTQKKLGGRIAELRKRKGLSQNDLARTVSISRPSIAQIELGKRNLNVIELQKLSLILGFSLDEFMSDNFSVKNEFQNDILPKSEIINERISFPEIQPEKFGNVLLYILERCAGKPNVGETVISKLLYFADFNYYELYEEHLTGAVYRKLPFGPAPEKLESIIQQMIANSQLQRVKTEYHGYPQIRFLPLEKPDLKGMKASEKDVIDRVIEQMSDWSAAAISSYSHQDMPWLASKEGEDIEYELVFYRGAPFSIRNYSDENEQP
ncbi:MAG: type II toxin-antitoxin system antitoxin SocA domain-containing protein [Bacteroidota bacterium]